MKSSEPPSRQGTPKNTEKRRTIRMHFTFSPPYFLAFLGVLAVQSAGPSSEIRDRIGKIPRSALDPFGEAG
jgi:hypothetical protein